MGTREISMSHYIGSTFRDSCYVDIFERRKKKTMQWSYDNNLRSFITDLFKRDAFRLYRDGNKLMINQ